MANDQIRTPEGEGNRMADRRYREKAREFSESFDPKDMGKLKQLAHDTKTRIDRTLAELEVEADEQVLEARRLLAEALHDLGNRIDN